MNPWNSLQRNEDDRRALRTNGSRTPKNCRSSHLYLVKSKERKRTEREIHRALASRGEHQKENRLEDERGNQTSVH